MISTEPVPFEIFSCGPCCQQAKTIPNHQFRNQFKKRKTVKDIKKQNKNNTKNIEDQRKPWEISETRWKLENQYIYIYTYIHIRLHIHIHIHIYIYICSCLCFRNIDNKINNTRIWMVKNVSCSS